MNPRDTAIPSESGLTTTGILTRLGISTVVSALPSAFVAVTADVLVHSNLNNNEPHETVANDWHTWLAFGATMTLSTLAIFSAFYKCATRNSPSSEGYVAVSADEENQISKITQKRVEIINDAGEVTPEWSRNNRKNRNIGL